jgi:hypothetical protein
MLAQEVAAQADTVQLLVEALVQVEEVVVLETVLMLAVVTALVTHMVVEA